jgi:NAD+ synthase
MIKDYSKVVNEIRKSLRIYLLENKLQSLVLGVSGGMDSALVAALAKPVCDDLNIPILGRSLTIQSNKPDEIARAEEIGRRFCHDFKEHDLTMDYYHMKHIDTLDDNKDTDVNSTFNKIKFGNMKARIRMIYLYNLAYKNRGLVLSTDNYTEFLVGFWTLHGDVGDYGMIQELWKTEVYNMAEWLCANELTGAAMNALWSCVVCTATDGLGVSNSDLDQLIPGWVGNSRDGYKVVDSILDSNINEGKEYQNSPVIDRMKRTNYKRNNPLNLKREDIVKE